MKLRIRSSRFLLVLTLGVSLTSCEGYKTMTVTNESKTEARVIVKPALNNFEVREYISNAGEIRTDSSIFVLQPDSSVTLVTRFTSLAFGTKIYKNELRFGYLRIERAKDTLVLTSKGEIVNLLYEKSSRPNWLHSPGSNRNIIIIK